MAYHPPTPDIPLTISSPSTSVRGERRLNPSWPLATLKRKLEPITGLPPSAQSLTLHVPGQPPLPLAAADEEDTLLSSFPLTRGAEIEVRDTRPPGSFVAIPGTGSVGDGGEGGGVDKYEMPLEEYEARGDSVLAWKKKAQLGRFDPSTPEVERKKIEGMWSLLKERGVSVGKRAQLGEDSARRGVVRWVGEVPELPGGGGVKGGPWVGVELDEPGGRNDGSVAVPGGGKENGGEGEEGKGKGEGEGKGGRKRYFSCGANRGVFVRPERVFVGEEFGALDLGLEGEDEDMEEI